MRTVTHEIEFDSVTSLDGCALLHWPFVCAEFQLGELRQTRGDAFPGFEAGRPERSSDVVQGRLGVAFTCNGGQMTVAPAG